MSDKKHSVSINEELYNDIKEYCELNNLKIISFINNLLNNAFLTEKYGDAPFLKPFYKSKNAEAEELYKTIVDGVGGEDAYNKIIDDLIFEDKEEKKEISIPEKNKVQNIEVIEKVQETTDTNIDKQTIKVNKPTKRRLK